MEKQILRSDKWIESCRSFLNTWQQSILSGSAQIRQYSSRRYKKENSIRRYLVQYRSIHSRKRFFCKGWLHWLEKRFTNKIQEVMGERNGRICLQYTKIFETWWAGSANDSIPEGVSAALPMVLQSADMEPETGAGLSGIKMYWLRKMPACLQKWRDQYAAGRAQDQLLKMYKMRRLCESLPLAGDSDGRAENDLRGGRGHCRAR